MDDYPRARACYQDALARYRELGFRWGEAICLARLEALKD